MSASSNHNRRIDDVLQTLGVSDGVIAWWQSQGLGTCSDLQVVAEHFLPPCDTFVVVWRQMQRKPVTMVAQIVEVMKEFKPKVEPRRRTFRCLATLQLAKQGGPIAVL